MPLDLEYLRSYYSELSDDALLAVKRSDLVDDAQSVYDVELRNRELPRQKPDPTNLKAKAERDPDKQSDDRDALHLGDKPAWIAGAAVIFSAADLPGTGAAKLAADVRDVLESASLPCHLEISHLAEDQTSSIPPCKSEWSEYVPGELALQAASVLDRDIYNAQFEAEWRAHLQTLSDHQLLALKPERALCGLFDRIERASKVYEEVITQRGLGSRP